MHYWRKNNALQTLGVPWPAAAGPPGPGGHYFFTNNALAGILIIIFHCNVKPFVLGHRIGLDPKRDHFTFGIPACWFRKSLVDPTQSNTDPTQTLTDQRQTLMDPTGDNGIKVALGPAALVPVLAMYISCFVC